MSTAVDRTAAQVLQEWQTQPNGLTAFLLSITDRELERLSRLALEDSDPLAAQALALLKALYSVEEHQRGGEQP